MQGLPYGKKFCGLLAVCIFSKAQTRKNTRNHQFAKENLRKNAKWFGTDKAKITAWLSYKNLLWTMKVLSKFNNKGKTTADE